MPDSPPPDALVSTVARDLAVARLSEAYANDVMPLAELERRIASAYAASSPAELAVLTHDIPQVAGGNEVLAPAIGRAAPPLRVSAVFGNVERGGFVEVPRYLELRVFCGNVELDLTQAVFAPGLTEIFVRSMMGNVEIALPPGVVVENYADNFMSSIECDGAGFAAAARDDVSVVRLTGRAVLSSMEITI